MADGTNRRLEAETLVVGYAMSRLDAAFLLRFGFSTWREAFNKTAKLLTVASASMKNLRDEYDPLHSNARDSVIHVTAAPSERLIAKCIANLSANLRPIVVCPYHRIGLARGLAETAGVGARVEVYDAQSFISMNLNEVANFSCATLSVTTARFVDRYNALIETHEGDPSLLLKAK